jgi:hypothetical protein
MALSSADEKREIPVITKSSQPYSGFHQGSGETTIAELLQSDLARYSLILIDEIESSLHPRAQRRLIRDLAERCRQKEIQIILTTHSPYVLEELPFEARKYILETKDTKKIVSGVSPQFAMTKMDDENYPECDLYVEDDAAKTLLSELIAFHGKDVVSRCQIIPFGATNVGLALGQMVAAGRFPRPSRVFLDGDNADADGCVVLPGGDAPEQVVFKALQKRQWGDVHGRISRDVSVVAEACSSAMTLGDHHEWTRLAANKLKCPRDSLWQAMCAEWAKEIPETEAAGIVSRIEEILP